MAGMVMRGLDRYYGEVRVMARLGAAGMVRYSMTRLGSVGSVRQVLAGVVLQV